MKYKHIINLIGTDIFAYSSEMEMVQVVKILSTSWKSRTCPSWVICLVSADDQAIEAAREYFND